ncbi:excinuclease ABC subunit C, partial [bacterium]|nr:excinuclease ABC subunit C [bacterium]
AMMRQVLLRRLSHLDEVRDLPAAREFRLELQSREPHTAESLKSDLSLETRPDLIIVDGGLGQLGIAAEVLQRFELDNKIALAGLAKRQEELFLPGQKLSILLPEGSSAYNAVTHLRNEAHRFAITFHRQLRSKAMTKTGWQNLPGVGPQTAKLLRARFLTLERLAEATPEQLQEVKGVGPKTAQTLWQALHKKEQAPSENAE